jgi:hypothetical protein
LLARPFPSAYLRGDIVQHAMHGIQVWRNL